MVSNQVLGARAAAGLLMLSLAVSGCAHFHHDSQSAVAPAATTSTSTAAAATATPAPPDMTATEAAIANAGDAGAAPAAAPVPQDTSDMLKPTAPMQYTVKRGDTLWGIASMYLKDPWLWPEVWVINPQVPNPHLIYPGDKLALAYGANGRPQVMLAEAGAVRMDPRLRSEPLNEAIPTIPYSSIAAFLSRPTVMTSDDIKHAPYVVAFRGMHQVAGSGIEVYVNNLSAPENSRFAVMHVGGPLRDPDDGKVVGYEGIYAATALVQHPGEPAKAVLIDPARETLQGDRLLSAESNETPLTFTPRAPASDVKGRIIDVVGGTDLVGQFEVVVINRGKQHGIQPGNVLAIDAAGDTVRDLYSNGRQIGDSVTVFAKKIKLPAERNGTLLVFKVYDRVSYALIVGASDTIHVGDFIRNP
jgi:LysM repeat protein